MVVYFRNIKQDYVLVCDIEYECNEIIQASGIIFKLVDKENSLYQLYINFNYYIKNDTLNKYTIMYTGLTPKFLNENGISKEEFITTFTQLISSLPLDRTLFVSHGAKNDRLVFKNFGIKNLPLHSYCTYKNAKRILKREKHLTLSNVAEEAGFKLFNEHNAHYDVLATIAVFSFLQKIELDEIKEEE